jgi:hypothetical protein
MRTLAIISAEPAKGRAADLYGVAAPIYIMTGLCFVASCLSLFLTETAPVKKAVPAPAPA